MGQTTYLEKSSSPGWVRWVCLRLRAEVYGDGTHCRSLHLFTWLFRPDKVRGREQRMKVDPVIQHTKVDFWYTTHSPVIHEKRE
jgi:hypothetical protein